ncbi:HAD family acid phosphatase [Gordonia sp. N1V]|uniref:phosphatase domain-containing protein n=1 Tax=Gordonia sp. N1V TaxID=3034163 RepID=UPI0023E1FB65|nr:HAD family acid phosphatase [Gordonia sp. N1V]MDF3280878.1 HAD family acid phosphatase [Gordonia sp. N1V]
MKKKAVIVDVDGTLADVSDALHHITTPGVTKDFDAFHKAAFDCPPVERTMEWCRMHYDAGLDLLVVTGRGERYREGTEAWLKTWMDRPYIGPWMRPDNDHRPDTVVKKEIYSTLVGEYDYEIVGAIDDRPSIIRLWRSLGIETDIVYREDWVTAGESYEGLLA